MSYEYHYDLPTNLDAGALQTILLGFLGLFVIILAAALILWVIRSIALYTIARRRGMSSPWLSWLPFGSDWVLGSLADQYQHLTQGKVTSRRKILLILKLVQFALVLYSGVNSALVSMAAANGAEVGTGIVGLVISLLTWGINITALVYYHMCNFDLYRSCDPDNAALYLVLGIILAVTEPFFYLVNRKKDKGFPSPNPQPPVGF